MRVYFLNHFFAITLIILASTVTACVNASKAVKYTRINATVESISKEVWLTTLPGDNGGYDMSIEVNSPMQLRGVKFNVFVPRKYERRFEKKKINSGDTISFDVPDWIFNNYGMPLWFYEMRNIKSEPSKPTIANDVPASAKTQ
ncbi:hypothetical protein M2447_002366 [Ereboglobus sp. PH5-10]|uniref:hypothetical protein n=1 Tax=Ereboglobus sp. PH5-10 TaxID=2940629 RepID=UPI002407406F|nr:hypothetical protein [Ereboglobus sp. PH5-10]MDF9828248.1 hypothetical protein [Ereboglobus sp. PH5-10]